MVSPALCALQLASLFCACFYLIGSCTVNHFRAIWISDLHLGAPSCQAAYLLDFLRRNDADTLYLVGDIVDGWHLKKTLYWPPVHNEVVQQLLSKASSGTEVLYIPGNHDEVFKQYFGLVFGNIKIVKDCVHTTLNGKRLWVTHGDSFDGVIQYAKWLAYAGDNLYSIILRMNRYFNRIRVRMGFRYWSLSQYLKHQVKNAVSYISDFEHVMVREARLRNCDGIVCGHIHKAEIRLIDGLYYYNDGDWVESLTALVETHEGYMKIIHWSTLNSNDNASLP